MPRFQEDFGCLRAAVMQKLALVIYDRRITPLLPRTLTEEGQDNGGVILVVHEKDVGHDPPGLRLDPVWYENSGSKFCSAVAGGVNPTVQ